MRHLLAALLLLCGFMIACGGYNPGEEPAASATEALTTEAMHVQPGTVQMVAPKGRLSDDPAHPSPNLVLITLLNTGTGVSGSYSTTAHAAILAITPAQFTSINTQLAAAAANPTLHHVDCSLAYDPVPPGVNKPVSLFSCVLV